MTISVRHLGLPGVMEIVPRRHADERGVFCEAWNEEEFRRHGVVDDFIQDNHSVSLQAGVLRGLHYQLPPYAQTKLVRVVQGSIFDVVVDIQPQSPTFGHWVCAELSALCWNQLLVPAGYAHGFVTLEPNTEVIYKISRPYSREHERAIRFDDPEIDIAWPIDASRMQLSEKDRMAPFLAGADLPGVMEERA